jgi:hypothetical protein
MDKFWAYVAIGHRFKYLYNPFVLVLMILILLRILLRHKVQEGSKRLYNS